MATDTQAAARDALAERLFGAALGAYELMTVHLGDRLGLYRALREHGETTPVELAAATGTNERYAREWLEQQAVAGILEVDDVAAAPDARRYRLPPAHAEVLVDRDSLAHLTPLARYSVSFAHVLPAVEEAFRRGGGVPWEEYGELGREAQGDANRPLFANLLGSEWLPAITDVHERLLADPPARVADVACGAGWSSIAIASAYPMVTVDGYDLDESSVELARANLAGTGVEDRVSFHRRDAGDPELAGSYQLVTVFEAIHDMPRPVEVLRALGGLAADDGAVVVMDERVADVFTAPGDEVERLMYTYSVLCCLPVGLAETPSAGTGTVMRTDTLRRYAA
ncbi:MAG TPA: class I SAM-dependent methyltransferase, partial [Gaiellaceae bacterium]|nr:class I SAM-dependent methyltransferase [Gaiellaceae bacterium]